MNESISKTYNVIWIDDKYKEYFGLIPHAKTEGIRLYPFELGVDGLEELRANLIKYDAVILDVKCLYDTRDASDSSANFYLIHNEILRLSIKTGEEIPCFVYSGQPDYSSNSEFENYLNGNKLYIKGSDDKQLLNDIKTTADKRINTQIRHKYLDLVGILPDNILAEMTDILAYIENHISNRPDVFNKMRNVINWVMDELNEYGLLALKHNGSNINACSLYLGKNELKEFVPIHIKRSLHSCVSICNNGSHRMEIFSAVQGDRAPFLIQSTVFELLNILKWYNMLPRDDESIREMRAIVASVHPDDLIEGELKVDNYGNYYCEDCLLHKGKVEEMGIELGELIRVVKLHKNTNLNPKIRERFPRFSMDVIRQD